MRFPSCLVAITLTAAFVAACIAPAHAGLPSPLVMSCKLIKTPAQLQAMSNDLAANYCLARDIDMSSVANFTPVGIATPFSGNFFGNNHVISNLTINDNSSAYVGLFGRVQGSQTIQDVTLRNVKVTASAASQAAALAGSVFGSSTTPLVVARIHVSGSIECNASCSGIIGDLGSFTTLTQSSSSADVTGADDVAGAVDFFNGTIDRVYATGRVTCIGGASSCAAGGLAGRGNTAIMRSYATGPVFCSSDVLARAGGLVAVCTCPGISRSFATGSVTIGPNDATAWAGGLAGEVDNATNKIDQTYSTGAVSGGDGGMGVTLGGLIGQANGSPVITNSYWDTQQSGQATSAGGAGAVGQTTAQLRADLPAGFGKAWAINKTLSYPFLNDDMDFTAPLAMVMVSSKLYTLLPLGQLDKSLYDGATAHIDEASRAAVFAMIGRAIGATDSVGALKAVKIDKYWDDAAKTTTLKGTLKNLITIGASKNIAAANPLDPVVAKLDAKHLVILRGTFTKSDGTAGTHYLLATLYTKNNNGSTATVVANDPYTGAQVEIDPDDKTIVFPSTHPLSGLTVTAYEVVTILP